MRLASGRGQCSDRQTGPAICNGYGYPFTLLTSSSMNTQRRRDQTWSGSPNMTFAEDWPLEPPLAEYQWGEFPNRLGPCVANLLYPYKLTTN